MKRTLVPVGLVLAYVFAARLGAAPGDTAGASSPVFRVYGDSLAPGWEDWSWQSSVNFNVSSPVFTGKRALSWTVTHRTGGLYLHSDAAVDMSPYTVLTFALQASKAGQTVSVVLEDVNDNPVGPVVFLTAYGGTPSVGIWRRYEVPLSALGATGAQVGGVIIQDETNHAQPAMYVDEIAFLATSPTGAVTVTTTPRATTTITASPSPSPSPSPPPTRSPTATGTATRTPTPTPAPSGGKSYPWHRAIYSTTFWVGEIYDPNLPDGSQVFSTYDALWEQHFGGCDGVSRNGSCDTEPRSAANNYFPSSMTPRENPFYLDLPFDDINDPIGFAQRDSVVPWANVPPYTSHRNDGNFSYMKNRWVRLVGPNGHTCYGQVEDAGPSSGSLYHDANYVFGANDARPASKLFNNAGLDVSPALNGCLGFSDLNGENDLVDWQFLDDQDVPSGPWKLIVTTTPVYQ